MPAIARFLRKRQGPDWSFPSSAADHHSRAGRAGKVSVRSSFLMRDTCDVSEVGRDDRSFSKA